MGKLKWDVSQVHKALDELEQVIQEIKPITGRIDRKAKKLRKMEHLPQYVTQRLDNLIMNNTLVADRCFASVRSVRSALPEIERSGRRKRYPAVVEGKKYRVVLGGCFLTRKATGPHTYYAHEESKNLHVGDIITYRGRQTGLLLREDNIKRDAFEFEGFLGVFHPNKEGKANRAHLIHSS